MNLQINDTPRTKWFIECIASARYPKREEDTSQSVTPINKPVHDWTSHHRTELEYFSVNYNSQGSGNPSDYYSSSPESQSAPSAAIAINGIGFSDSLDAILNRNSGSEEW